MAVSAARPASATVEKGSLPGRLAARREKIEAELLARIRSIADADETIDPEYLEGLRAAVSRAFEYALAALEGDEVRPPPIPTILLSQARLAARYGVKLDTVLRRYAAGNAVLAGILVSVAGELEVPTEELGKTMTIQATLFDRLLAAVSEEYRREAAGRPRSVEERRAQYVKRLIAGDLRDASQLDYDLEAHHIGMILTSDGAVPALRELARDLDVRLLWVPSKAGTLWAWLGSRRLLGRERLEERLADSWPSGVVISLGVSAQGREGWRLTHRQAKATLPLALHGGKSIAFYEDVVLLAAVLRDDLLAASLRQLYLEPLERERDGGEVAKQTLRAYFAAERNGASAAAMLGISRQGVRGRLDTIEAILERPLGRCLAELEVALRLEGLDNVRYLSE